MGVDSLLIGSEVVINHPYLANIFKSSGFLLGPVLYFYTCALLAIKRRFALPDLIHLIPFALALTFIIVLLHPDSVEPKGTPLGSYDPDMIPYFRFLIILLYVFMGLYITTSLLVLRKQGLRLRSFFSNLNSFRLSWIRSILGLFAAFVLVRIIMFVLPYPSSDPGALSILTSLVWYLWMSLLLSAILLMVYNALKQHPVFVSPSLLNQLQENEGEPNNQQLTQEGLEQKAGDMINKIKAGQWFLDPEISLADLSAKLHLDTAQVSQLINLGLGKNFFGLINGLRCEHAATLLKSSNESIINILFDSGFNSKATFNRVFKEYFGLTPSQYKLKVKDH